AIDLDSKMAKLYKSRGKVNRSLGRYHEAGKDFKKARELGDREKRLPKAP
ncbi:MAG: hypothetical protein JRJ85_00490, partial [Deltaproteobacteria bacterium]|nr:hypothetical protein [Deltaproteobacteria bacterium]